MINNYFTATVNELGDNGVKLLSRELDILPGHMIRTSTARLIAQSENIIIFLTSDYLKDDTTRFEFNLIKQKGLNKVVVVTVAINSVSQLDHLPTELTDIISHEEHIVWPTGLCASGHANIQAFLQTLLKKISNIAKSAE